MHGPAGLEIDEADAANLDFGALQALISQQMASIEAEWEPDVGGRPPSSDFLRAEAESFQPERDLLGSAERGRLERAEPAAAPREPRSATRGFGRADGLGRGAEDPFRLEAEAPQ